MYPKHPQLNDHLGAEGMDGEGPKSWGAALAVARRAVAARTTEANIVQRIFQDCGQPENCESKTIDALISEFFGQPECEVLPSRLTVREKRVAL